MFYDTLKQVAEHAAPAYARFLARGRIKGDNTLLSLYGNFATPETVLELLRDLAAAQARIKEMTEVGIEIQNERLARYEAAERAMPEEPERLTMTRELVSGGFATETMVAAHKYDQLRDFAIAQKVRADENEPDARLYKYLRERVEVRNIEAMNGTRRPGLSIAAGMSFFDSKTARSKERVIEQAKKLDTVIEAAIKEQT